MSFVSEYLVKLMQKKRTGPILVNWILDCLTATVEISHYFNLMQLLSQIKGEANMNVLEADYQINSREPRTGAWTRHIVCAALVAA